MLYGRNCLLFLVLLITGCSGGLGAFTLFPTGHYLTDTASRVRATSPTVADLPRELQKSVLPDYIIEPGDGLLVEPASFESPIRFPADQTVLADGTIDLGKYGRPIVAGLRLEQIEAEVEAAIWREEQEKIERDEAKVNVRLINPQSKVYYVLGEVNSPGAYPLNGQETALDGIIAAGGLTDAASPCDIILAHPTPSTGCRVVHNICYRQIVQLGDTSTNYQLRPGDRIYVATRDWWENLLPCSGTKDCPLCRGCGQCPCPEADHTLIEQDVMYHVPPHYDSARDSPRSVAID